MDQVPPPPPIGKNDRGVAEARQPERAGLTPPPSAIPNAHRSPDPAGSAPDTDASEPAHQAPPNAPARARPLVPPPPPLPGRSQQTPRPSWMPGSMPATQTEAANARQVQPHAPGQTATGPRPTRGTVPLPPPHAPYGTTHPTQYHPAQPAWSPEPAHRTGPAPGARLAKVLLVLIPLVVVAGGATRFFLKDDNDSATTPDPQTAAEGSGPWDDDVAADLSNRQETPTNERIALLAADAGSLDDFAADLPAAGVPQTGAFVSVVSEVEDALASDDVCALANRLDRVASPSDLPEVIDQTSEANMQEVVYTYTASLYSALAACRGNAPISATEASDELLRAHELLRTAVAATGGPR